MTDDDLLVVRELFAADDHPLDETTAARLFDRLEVELATAAGEQDPPHTGPPSLRRRHRRRRVAVVAGALVAAVAAVTLAVVLLPTDGPSPPGTSRSAAHHHVTRPVPAPRQPAQTTTPPHFVVAGYTVSQAQQATAQCLSAAGAMGQKDAALRATFTDTLGSLLVVTTPAGFYTCDEAPDGTFTSSGLLRTYQGIDGSGSPPGSPTSPNSPGAHWLLEPVELDSSGGGYPSKTQTTIWVTTTIGRVAPDVAKVVIQPPGRPAVTATVENGFFVARQVAAGPPTVSHEVATIPILAYDAAGALVYDSLTAPTAVLPGQAPPTPPPCFVTPSGQPVTHASPGQHCQTAVAWGY